MAKTTSAQEDALTKIRDRYQDAIEYWTADREAALDDIKFRAGEQWPSDIVNQRERDKRPCLTVDKLAQYVRQIVNDGRQNRPSIKVRPVDSGADIATSEVFQGIIRHIEDRSCADAAYDTALDSAATCGQGYFTVRTEYANDMTFEQEIVIKRVRNPLSIVIDPMSKEADGSDMRFAFEIEEMTKEDFEAKYPGKTPESFEKDVYGDWFGDIVRIARYWHIVEEDRELYLLENGSVIDKTQYDQLVAEGLEVDSAVVEKRNIPKRTVKHCLVTGRDYLEEPKEWPGKYIPILVVWGNEIDIEGEVTHSGIIRPAKDAQRLYNYSRSAFAERVALTPKAPWIAAEGQIEDYENEWATANTDNHSVLRYRPVSLNGSPVPAPQRQTMADIPAGFAQDMQISEHDIQAAIGMYNASLGAPSNERSGKAIMARQKEGDVGTFHYHDNLNRAIRHCGRILVDLIPKIYDTNRVVRILGYDGKPDEAQINPMLPTASQQMGLRMMYNLTVGTYDVTISSGPSYNTLRQEAAESMLQMVQANPELMGVIGDLLVKNMDWPGAEEISERLKLTLPPEIQQAEMQKKQQTMPPEMQQIVQQFEQVIQERDAALQEASAMMEQLQGELQALKQQHDAEVASVRNEAEANARDAEIREKELKLKAVDSEIKAYEAETKRIQALESSKADIEPQESMAEMQSILGALDELRQTISTMQSQPQQPQQQPVINVSVGGKKRKQMQIMAPSGQMYTGVIEEDEIEGDEE